MSRAVRASNPLDHALQEDANPGDDTLQAALQNFDITSLRQGMRQASSSPAGAAPLDAPSSQFYQARFPSLFNEYKQWQEANRKAAEERGVVALTLTSATTAPARQAFSSTASRSDGTAFASANSSRASSLTPESKQSLLLSPQALISSSSVHTWPENEATMEVGSANIPGPGAVQLTLTQVAGGFPKYRRLEHNIELDMSGSSPQINRTLM